MNLLISIFVIILIFRIAGSIYEKKKQKEYKIRLEKYGNFIEDHFEFYKQLDITKLKQDLSNLLSAYKSNQIILKDKSGTIVNVCPKCSGTFRKVIARSGNKFLGCSNYPKCRSYGDIERLKDLDI